MPNQQSQLIIIALVATFMVGILVLFGIAIVSMNKHRRNMEKITLYSINVASQIDKSIPEILDLMIQDSFNDYKLKCLLPLEEGYINSEKEEEIRKGLVAVVTSRLSEAALDKISLFYNIENIASILADKIYITVMNYVIEHNTPYVNPSQPAEITEVE